MGIICSVFLMSCSTEKEVKVDLLIKNANIWTGDVENPTASWVAVSNGRIHAIGSEKEQSPKSEKTIDADGRLLLPGFNDSHVHFASAGQLLLGINLLDVSGKDLFIQRVRETTERLPKGSWITRGDWGAYEAWSMGSEGGDTKNKSFEPSRSMIDSITTDYPVLVTRYDRKMGLANGAALEYLNIDSESGVLTGTELTNAMEQIPEKSFERKVAETKRGLDECRKWGVTTVQDMSPLDQVDIYEYLKESGELTCRINFSPSRLIEYENMIQNGWVIQKEGNGSLHPAGDDWISFGTLKTHIDGIMGARSARFYEPYSDNDMENKDWKGGWREFSRDMPEFKRMIMDADANDIQMRIHAIGDEANAILLDIVDSMEIVNGKKDRRFRIVHAQVVSPRDFERFRGKDIVAEVQPYHVTDDMRWMEERIGYERCKGAYAFKTLEANDCILSFGSDWPGTNASYYPINPLYGLYAAVTRQTVNGTPEEGWFQEQRITLDDAIKAYTWGSSYGAFEENSKGTLEEGKLADMVILDTNLFETEPEEWLKAEVNYTVVGGKVVYQN